MDTIEKESKQGADTPADLLKQKPQEEVLKSKHSTASSEEEKLAAGISTIGLWTKRISGAQRKKLARRRKVSEGTWIEKPNRITPPSQNKGTAGSSGGLKDPSQTPAHHPKENSNPRNPGAPRCRLEPTRKLLSESRWQLCTGCILMLTWIRLRLI
jgi:hypothetical protein